MADTAVEASGIPQVFPGTMLKIEEGQNCAVLCAADDELSSASATRAGLANGRPYSRQTAQDAKPPAVTAAASRDAVNGFEAKASGGAVGSLHKERPHGSKRVAAVGTCLTGDPLAAWEDYDYGFEDDFADGGTATATAGDGSSSSGDDTETFSELSDPGGTEVVFVREGVAVWPGARSERILGRFSLVKQCSILFMAWLPYSRGVLLEDGTFRVITAGAAAAARATTAVVATAAGPAEGHALRDVLGATASTAAVAASEAVSGGGQKDAEAEASTLPGGSDRTLYAVHPIPLSEVKALRRRTPALGLGCPSLVVVLTSGVTLPPLYFQEGGIKALINILKQHAFLLKSADEPHTYLVNDTADPLSRSLSALQLSDVLIGGPPPGASATFKPGEGVVVGPAAADAVTAPPPPHAAAAVEWATPTTGVGLAAAAGLGRDGGVSESAGCCHGQSGGGFADAGGGLAMGLRMGLGTAVSWCWADQPPARVAAAVRKTNPCTIAATGLGGFEAVEEGEGGGEDDGDGLEDVTEGVAAATRRQPNAWAYGIVDAINRFVQNVRGTASGWIGALDDLDEQDDDLYGDNSYGRPPYNDTVREAAPLRDSTVTASIEGTRSGGTERRRQETPGGSGGGMHPLSPDAAVAAPTVPVNAGGCPTAGDAVMPAIVAADAGSLDVNTAVGDFELVDSGGCWGEAAAHPPSRRRLRPPPLSAEEWAAMFDADGRLMGEAALRDRVCLSGCVPELRREVWKHLLEMYPRGSTAAQKSEMVQKWQSEYTTLRQQWQSMVPAQEARCGSWRCHRTAVDKDVRRTDRSHPFFAREGCAGLRALRNVLLTHVVYDRDLGYCQGMSDLAAPLLVVMRDEAEAFWAFAALMERMGPNFHSDLQGMNLQLGALRRLMQLLDPPLHVFFERRDCLSYYFAFRWLLIMFKREFKYDEVLSLWEACWACRRTRHLHLFMAAAVLVHHRRVILSSPDLDFDGMLRLSIGLAGRLELQPLLETAEALVGYAGEAGKEITAWLP